MSGILPSKYKIISGSTLKLIAVISMLIDHTAHILRADVSFMRFSLFSIGERNITVYYIMRMLGRIAFPIFCFLIAEGVANTKNIKKYMARLFIFAVISEIPYNLMSGGNILHIAKQNIFFTLFFGALMIWTHSNVNVKLTKLLLMSLIAAMAILLRVDYGLQGVLLIFLMHLLKQYPAAQIVFAYPLLSGSIMAMSSFVPISMYNGERGFIKTGAVKYIFYFFYPVHILVLILIKHLI